MKKKSNIKWISIVEKIEEVFSLLPPTIFILLTNPIISFPLTHQEKEEDLDEKEKR